MKNTGIAVSPSGEWLVVSHSSHRLSVYNVVDGSLRNSIGKLGRGKGEFHAPGKLSFSVVHTDHVLVADCENHRVQEVSLSGAHVRFIGVGVIDDIVLCLAVNAEQVVVGKDFRLSADRVLIFDYRTGALQKKFGATGEVAVPRAMRFSPDHRHLVITDNNRLAVFTKSGKLVHYIGAGSFLDTTDLEFAPDGCIVVSGTPVFGSHRMTVFSPDGKTMLRQWGCVGDGNGEFTVPISLAVRNDRLFVADRDTQRIQVFS